MCFKFLGRFTFLLGGIFSFQSTLTGQVALAGLDLGVDVVAWYDDQIGLENAGLVVGTYHNWNRASRDSDPFLVSDRWALGTIRYRGQTYTGINLLYDVYEDLVYLQHPTKLIYSNQVIKLIPHQIEWFDFHGRRFYFINDKVLQHRPGFHEKLYEGQSVTLLAKRIKEQRIERTIFFESADAFIIQVGNQYYPFKSRSSLNRLLPDYKKEIKQFVRDQKLVIQNGPESNLVALIRHCDPFFAKTPMQP